MLTQLFSEKIDFKSGNPFSFVDIINSLDNLEEQLVFGELKLPYASSKKFPLIIGVAGSLGWKEHHLEQLQMYRELGIATFELKSFESRGVTSTVGTQTEVTTATLILDSYNALNVLSNHPNIDNENIAITGWSLGGATTLFSAWMPIIKAIKPKNKFAAHLSYYPPCVATPNNMTFSDVPIHILIGEIDDWTPANACVEFVDSMKKEGYDVGISIYENSHHSFDSELPITYIENGYSLTDCSLKIRDDGAVLMNFLSIPMTSPFYQKIGLSLCADRGTTIGGNNEARIDAHEFSKSFMKKHLLK
tara:strand:+ start:138 stop:1052 length:915 start_codon:yes stop_codon:yes gene_type:complete